MPYAFGYDPLIGCQLCGCEKEGSHDGQMQCDPLNGQCLCKENVGGRRCEKCLPGYYGFPHCYECACEDRGTTDQVCDPSSAVCLCKKNVVGKRCDTCRHGTFDLRKSDMDGCSECFCFGATDRCRSSNFTVHTLSFDTDLWRSTDSTGLVEGKRGKVTYLAGSNGKESDPRVYFVVPITAGADYTTSYGLHFSYTVHGTPNGKVQINNGADIQLVSGDTTLEYWASEQPSNLSAPFHILVSLFPEYWISKSGEPSSRGQLMQVLLKLDKVLVKASYYER